MIQTPCRFPPLVPGQRGRALSDVRIVGLIETVVERCGGPGEPRPGHPPVEVARVLATFRRLLLEGTP
jgi:hypothetical protein